MLRLLTARLRLLPAGALCALLSTAACGGGEHAQPNSAANANRAPATAASADTPAATTDANQPGASSAAAKLNLNTASEEEFLKGVPGLGQRMAHEFEEYRPYRSIQQFRREMSKYVKPEQIAEYEKYVYVPVSPNESDAATLQQIPGLDASEAEALIAARPYASPDAFLAKVAEKVSGAELAIARSYLSSR